MIGSNIFTTKKKQHTAQLSLVALMDIFTIMLFFLLLNAGESPKIQNAKFIVLPDSTSNTAPSNKILIYITEEIVWFGDKPVGDVAAILSAPEKMIDSLTAALTKHKDTITEFTEYEKVNGLSVTIMGDKGVSYTLLKSVMATCQGNNFRDISLAVNQVIPSSLPQTSAPAVPANAVTDSATKVGG
jgi:biopolymer transport protein ExbD